MRAIRLAVLWAAFLAMAALCACQLLLPFQEAGPATDGGNPESQVDAAPDAEADADARAADADAAAKSDAAADADAAADSGADTCAPGTCQPIPLAGNQTSPTCIRLYAGDVYWSTNSGASTSGIWHVPADGGGMPRTLATAFYVAGLTVGPNGVYWTDPSGVETLIDGGPSNFVGGTNAQMVTADDASVYWSDWGTNKPIYAEPFGMPAASPPTPIYPTNAGTAFGLVVSGGTLYWTTNDTNPMDGLVVSGSVAGGQATTMATGQANPLGVAVDTTAVYWANSGTQGADAGSVDQSVWMLTFSGNPTPLAQNLSHPVAVWSDPSTSYVYWVELGSPPLYADGRVVRASKTPPANPTVLATGQGAPSDITGDDTWIYWANAGAVLPDGGTAANGQIMKLPK
ncbi:MAG TPA: hypothetical protein VF765_29060 [Polyangiaceae bacterium]